MVLDPRTKLVEHDATVLLAPRSSLLGSLIQDGRDAFDEEELGDDLQSFESEVVTAAGSLDQTRACVRPTSRTLATFALDEARGVDAVALNDAAGELLLRTDEAGSAVALAVRPVEEANPATVTHATPHRAVAPAFGRFGIEKADTRRVDGHDSAAAKLLEDAACNRTEAIDRYSYAATECVRRDVDALPRSVCTLPLDGQMQQILVCKRLDDERVSELAAGHDAVRRWSRHDDVILRAVDGLVLANDDDKLGRSDVEHFTMLVPERLSTIPAVAPAERMPHPF